MLKTTRAKLVAALAALGLGSGLVVTMNADGCTVKPAAQEVDAGPVDSQPTASSSGVHDEVSETCHE